MDVFEYETGLDNLREEDMVLGYAIDNIRIQHGKAVLRICDQSGEAIELTHEDFKRRILQPTEWGGDDQPLQGYHAYSDGMGVYIDHPNMLGEVNIHLLMWVDPEGEDVLTGNALKLGPSHLQRMLEAWRAAVLEHRNRTDRTIALGTKLGRETFRNQMRQAVLDMAENGLKGERLVETAQEHAATIPTTDPKLAESIASAVVAEFINRQIEAMLRDEAEEPDRFESLKPTPVGEIVNPGRDPGKDHYFKARELANGRTNMLSLAHAAVSIVKAGHPDALWCGDNQTHHVFDMGGTETVIKIATYDNTAIGLRTLGEHLNSVVRYWVEHQADLDNLTRQIYEEAEEMVLLSVEIEDSILADTLRNAARVTVKRVLREIKDERLQAKPEETIPATGVFSTAREIALHEEADLSLIEAAIAVCESDPKAVYTGDHTPYHFFEHSYPKNGVMAEYVRVYETPDKVSRGLHRVAKWRVGQFESPDDLIAGETLLSAKLERLARAASYNDPEIVELAREAAEFALHNKLRDLEGTA